MIQCTHAERMRGAVNITVLSDAKAQIEAMFAKRYNINN